MLVFGSFWIGAAREHRPQRRDGVLDASRSVRAVEGAQNVSFGSALGVRLLEVGDRAARVEQVLSGSFAGPQQQSSCDRAILDRLRERANRLDVSNALLGALGELACRAMRGVVVSKGRKGLEPRVERLAASTQGLERRRDRVERACLRRAVCGARKARAQRSKKELLLVGCEQRSFERLCLERALGRRLERALEHLRSAVGLPLRPRDAVQREQHLGLRRAVVGRRLASHDEEQRAVCVRRALLFAELERDVADHLECSGIVEVDVGGELELRERAAQVAARPGDSRERAVNASALGRPATTVLSEQGLEDLARALKILRVATSVREGHPHGSIRRREQRRALEHRNRAVRSGELSDEDIGGLSEHRDALLVVRSELDARGEELGEGVPLALRAVSLGEERAKLPRVRRGRELRLERLDRAVRLSRKRVLPRESRDDRDAIVVAVRELETLLQPRHSAVVLAASSVERGKGVERRGGLPEGDDPGVRRDRLGDVSKIALGDLRSARPQALRHRRLALLERATLRCVKRVELGARVSSGDPLCEQPNALVVARPLGEVVRERLLGFCAETEERPHPSELEAKRDPRVHVRSASELRFAKGAKLVERPALFVERSEASACLCVIGVLIEHRPKQANSARAVVERTLAKSAGATTERPRRLRRERQRRGRFEQVNSAVDRALGHVPRDELLERPRAVLRAGFIISASPGLRRGVVEALENRVGARIGDRSDRELRRFAQRREVVSRRVREHEQRLDEGRGRRASLELGERVERRRDGAVVSDGAGIGGLCLIGIVAAIAVPLADARFEVVSDGSREAARRHGVGERDGRAVESFARDGALLERLEQRGEVAGRSRHANDGVRSDLPLSQRGRDANHRVRGVSVGDVGLEDLAIERQAAFEVLDASLEYTGALELERHRVARRSLDGATIRRGDFLKLARLFGEPKHVRLDVALCGNFDKGATHAAQRRALVLGALLVGRRGLEQQQRPCARVFAVREARVEESEQRLPLVHGGERRRQRVDRSRRSGRDRREVAKPRPRALVRRNRGERRTETRQRARVVLEVIHRGFAESRAELGAPDALFFALDRRREQHGERVPASRRLVQRRERVDDLCVLPEALSNGGPERDRPDVLVELLRERSGGADEVRANRVVVALRSGAALKRVDEQGPSFGALEQRDGGVEGLLIRGAITQDALPGDERSIGLAELVGEPGGARERLAALVDVGLERRSALERGEQRRFVFDSLIEGVEHSRGRELLGVAGDRGAHDALEESRGARGVRELVGANRRCFCAEPGAGRALAVRVDGVRCVCERRGIDVERTSAFGEVAEAGSMGGLGGHEHDELGAARKRVLCLTESFEQARELVERLCALCADDERPGSLEDGGALGGLLRRIVVREQEVPRLRPRLDCGRREREDLVGVRADVVVGAILAEERRQSVERLCGLAERVEPAMRDAQSRRARVVGGQRAEPRRPQRDEVVVARLALVQSLERRSQLIVRRANGNEQLEVSNRLIGVAREVAGHLRGFIEELAATLLVLRSLERALVERQQLAPALGLGEAQREAVKRPLRVRVDLQDLAQQAGGCGRVFEPLLIEPHGALTDGVRSPRRYVGGAKDAIHQRGDRFGALLFREHLVEVVPLVFVVGVGLCCCDCSCQSWRNGLLLEESTFVRHRQASLRVRRTFECVDWHLRRAARTPQRRSGCSTIHPRTALPAQRNHAAERSRA